MFVSPACFMQTDNTGGVADDPAPTTDATNALISEVLSDGHVSTDGGLDDADADDGTVSVSGTTSASASLADRDAAYQEE